MGLKELVYELKECCFEEQTIPDPITFFKDLYRDLKEECYKFINKFEKGEAFYVLLSPENYKGCAFYWRTRLKSPWRGAFGGRPILWGSEVAIIKAHTKDEAIEKGLRMFSINLKPEEIEWNKSCGHLTAYKTNSQNKNQKE